MVIRKMTKNDYDTYCRLSEKFYASGASITEITKENYTSTFNAVMSNSPYIKGFIVESDGKAAGYFLLTFTWYCEFCGETVTIDEIYIDDGFRGKGLGSMAIKWVYENHKDYHGIQVEVKKNNKKAIELYERLGFKFIDYIQMVIKPDEIV